MLPLCDRFRRRNGASGPGRYGRTSQFRARSWGFGLPAALAGLALWAAPVAALAEEGILEHARSLVREQRFAEAIDAYSEALERAPTDRDARLERSRVLGWLGRHPEALADLGVLLERDPDDAEAGVARARLLGWMGRHGEGEREARRVLAARPRDVEAHLALGDLQSWQERRSEALDAYSEAHRLAPEDARPLVGMGRALAGEGRWVEARAAFEHALEIQPHAADVREALRSLEGTPRRRGVRVDAGFQFDDLDGGRSDWWHGNAFLSVPVSEGLVLRGGVEQYRRFGENETQGTVGALFSLPHGWSIDALATMGFDVEAVARYVFDAEVARRLSERVTARARYRFSRFAGDVDSNAVSPGLEVSPSPELRVLARYHFTRLTGGRTGHSGSLHLDLLPESRVSPYAFGAYGTEVFAPTTVQQLQSRARILSTGVGLRWRVRDDLGLRVGVEYENLRHTYQRLGISTGFFVKF